MRLAPKTARIIQDGEEKEVPVEQGGLFRLVPGWDSCCREAGGPVLIGNPFSAEYAPGGKDLFVPERRDDAHSIRYLRRVSDNVGG